MNSSLLTAAALLYCPGGQGRAKTVLARSRCWWLPAVLLVASGAARADAVDSLRTFVRDVKSGQASSRKFTQALGVSPAAVLAGTALEPDFKLANLPSAQGLEWASATPRATGASFQELRVGFRGKDLVAIEITDSFGQRSRLDFSRFVANGLVPEARFVFKAPPGADVVEQ